MTDSPYDWTPFAGDRWSCENIGDAIKGKVTEITTKQGQRGAYPVLVLQVDDKGTKLEMHPPLDLQRKLAAANIQVGDWVAAELVEFKHTGQPQPMKIFRFASKPGNGTKPSAGVDPDDIASARSDADDAALDAYDDSPF